MERYPCKVIVSPRHCDDRSSMKEHREDALALRAEERRDKLRKAVGSCK